MTDAQKRYILDRRMKGDGPRKIATALGMSINTVKSFLRRNDSAKSDASEAQRNNALEATHDQCKQCGRPFTARAHTRPRLFCSDACRYAWWNAHRTMPGRKSHIRITCAHCGIPFDSHTPSRKFCGHPCYIAYRYPRRKEAGQRESGTV